MNAHNAVSQPPSVTHPPSPRVIYPQTLTPSTGRVKRTVPYDCVLAVYNGFAKSGVEESGVLLDSEDCLNNDGESATEFLYTRP